MLRPVKDGHGRVVGVKFEATARMQRVVLMMNKAENCQLSTEEILKRCNVSEALWKRWNNDYVIHEQDGNGNITATKNLFAEWLEEALEIKGGEEREMLRQIGLQKAMSGDYRYWADLSKTYGAVSKEAPPPERKTIPFNLPTNATKEQLLEYRQKLLESQRAVGDGSGSSMARLTTKRPAGSTN